MSIHIETNKFFLLERQVKKMRSQMKIAYVSPKCLMQWCKGGGGGTTCGPK